MTKILFYPCMFILFNPSFFLWDLIECTSPLRRGGGALWCLTTSQVILQPDQLVAMVQTMTIYGAAILECHHLGTSHHTASRHSVEKQILKCAIHQCGVPLLKPRLQGFTQQQNDFRSTQLEVLLVGCG